MAGSCDYSNPEMIELEDPEEREGGKLQGI